MSTIDFSVPTRASFVRLGLIFGVALVVAAVIALPQFSASKECRGGAFSSGFGAGLEVRRCAVVVKRFGDDLLRIPLPAW
jgi:hypothetical protein